MGVRFPSAPVVIASPVTVTAAVETVILTTPGISPPFDNVAILLVWYLDLLMGTAGTSFNVRIRRGAGITGTIVLGSSNITLAAGNIGAHGGFAVDTSPGAVGGAQYSLTCIQNAATGNGTVSAADFCAFVL